MSDPDASGRGLLADEFAELPVVSSELVFTGAVWNVRRDRLLYAGTEIAREYVRRQGAVGAFTDA